MSWRVWLALAAGAFAAACEREARPIDRLPGAVAHPPQAVLSELHPGRSAPPESLLSPFQNNAWGIAEGKRLFDAYNCSGCHAHGGGGMGPALMDERWIYGAQPANIYAAIVEGRPNGMPAFGGKINEAQVWQLVAYVRSMSGQSPIDALPSRADHLSAGTPENARPARTPIETGRP